MSDLFSTDQTRWDLRPGDCLAGMRQLPDESGDVVVTSPPYHLDIAYSSFHDDMPRAAYLEWCFLWAEQIARVLKPVGSFFLNIGAAPANPLLPHELVIKLQPLFNLQNTLHWIKSINSKRYLTACHEYVFHLTRSGKVPLDRIAVGVEYSDKSNITRWGHTEGKDRRCRGNNWFIPYETIRSRKGERPHPATFPTALAERCLRLHGLRAGLTMLDPFLGIGHSALATRACGAAHFIGFEIDAGYFQEACARLEIPSPVAS